MLKLKQFLEPLFWIALLFFVMIYYANYMFDGSLAFVSNRTFVYSTSAMDKVEYTLESGESFQALSGVNEATKIRYQNDIKGKEQIGFIHTSECSEYEFPEDYDDVAGSNNPRIIIAVKSNSESESPFEDFLVGFSKVLENYRVLGVYVDSSDNSISDFCEEQQIPYGKIYDDFTEEYVHEMIFDDSYNILPKVFNLDSSSKGPQEFFQAFPTTILKSHSKPSLYTCDRYWLDNNGTESSFGDDVCLTCFDEDENFTYSTVSADFESEIKDLYSELEDK